MSSLPRILVENTRGIEETLERLLPRGRQPEKALHDAMRYAVLGGGKRLRPALVVASAALFGVVGPSALRTAAAVEMTHCFSLVHDDLPALDNDELRRGRPTCHIAFGEATAILAGDGLLTQAFEVLSDPATHDAAEVRLELVRVLAEAVGASGMIAGQAIDLAFEHESVDRPGVERLQALKTGALFTFCTEAGAILGQADQDAREAMIAYGRNLGAAFQVADDLLDHEGDSAALGKAAGKDAAAGKATLVAVLGLEPARAMAQRFAGQAIDALEAFGEAAGGLKELARFAVERRS